MKDFEISTPSELTAASLSSELVKHKRLWAALSVRHSWFALTGQFTAALLLAFGFFAGDEGWRSAWTTGVVAFMIVQMQIWWALSQNETIATLLKRLEQRVTRIETNTFADR
jgi:hypothetical protein